VHVPFHLALAAQTQSSASLDAVRRDGVESARIRRGMWPMGRWSCEPAQTPPVLQAL
jgi:hypothetical protein